MKLLLGTKICMLYWRNYVKSGCAIAGSTVVSYRDFPILSYFFPDDVDGDGIPDAEDTDDDGDGIPDEDEGTVI